MDENKLLESRVEHLEERVRFLEKQLQVKNAVVHTPRIPEPVNEIKTKPIEWDVLIFQKILPPMFIVVFIIGVLWGFKAVSDYGIMTGAVKVMLGYIVGMVLISIGIWQIKQSRKNLGQMLLGGAIPILMLTTFAMHQLYSMTGPTVSFVLNILWISLGLFFTSKYRSQGIGIVSTVGGVFVPFLINSTSPNIPVFSFYEAILFTVFLSISLRYSYKLLFYVSVGFLQVALVVLYISTGVSEELKWIIVLPIFIQHVALLVGLLRKKNMLKDLAYTLFSVMLLTILWITIIFTDNEASIILLVVTLLYMICLYKFQEDVIRTPIFIANISLALLYLLQVQIEELYFEGLIGLSLVCLFVYKKFKNILHIMLCTFTYLLAMTFVFTNVMEVWVSWEMLHWTLFLVATGYGMYMLTFNNKQDTTVFNIGVPYIAALFLYYLFMIASLITGGTGSNQERVLTSGLWILTAVLFMLVSRRFSLQQGKYVGVGILFFTLAKIILFDISFVSVPIKALLFIVLGVVGLLVSRAYYKK